MLKQNSCLLFDYAFSDIYWINFWRCDWTDYYEGAMEPIPPCAPVLWGLEVDQGMFVYNNYAGKR